MFDVNPLEVGNAAMLGIFEEQIVNELNALSSKKADADFADIANILNEYHIDYDVLPHYIQEMIESKLGMRG